MSIEMICVDRIRVQDPGETRAGEPKMCGVFGRLCVSPFDRFRAMPNLSRTVGGKMAVR